MNSTTPTPPAPTRAATSADSTSMPTPRPESLALRLLRAAALLGLVIIFTFLLSLALLAASWRPNEGITAGTWTFIGIAAAPVALLLLAWRLRLRSWWWIAGGYLAVAPVFTYLAIDDPMVLHPVTIDEIAPAFPGAEKSYAVVMQYSKNHPSDEARAFNDWKPRLATFPASPENPAEWNAFLTKNRAAIEADWADLAPQRRWIEQLAAFDRLGDLGVASVTADIPAFRVWNILSQRTLHVAGLRMLDGQPDAAIETMLPLLVAGRKLQPSARTLVRFMIGEVVEKRMVLYSLDIVEHATVSAAMKAKLASVLAGGVRGEAGARRLVGLERVLYVTESGIYNQPAGDALRLVHPEQKRPAAAVLLNLLSPLLYNPNRTMNLLADFNAELQDLAARRALPNAGQASPETLRPHFKNFFGAILADHSTPAYGRIVATYWELNDAREKLVVRLAAAP